MTRGLLKEKLFQLLKEVDDPTYTIGDWQKVNEVIDRRVNRFMMETLCKWTGGTALGLVAHQAEYNLASLATPIVKPVDVFIEGYALQDYWGARDGAGWPEMVEDMPNGPVLPEGRPGRWLWSAEQKIILSPTPDQVYTNCFVSGWMGHAAIGAGADWATQIAADAVDNINVPDRWMDCLVEYIAMDFLNIVKHAELYLALEQRTKSCMGSIRAKNSKRNRGTVVKGKYKSSLTRRIGTGW